MEAEKNLKWGREELGREERFRTAISGAGPRRIAVGMLLLRVGIEFTPSVQKRFRGY